MFRYAGKALETPIQVGDDGKSLVLGAAVCSQAQSSRLKKHIGFAHEEGETKGFGHERSR